MIDGKKLYVIEYCPNQKCFHIQSLAKTITGNMIAIRENRVHTYLLLAVCETFDEAHTMRIFLEKQLFPCGRD